MAYFSNGCEGDEACARYCRRCIHNARPAIPCPVMVLHWDWNYYACNGDEPDATPEQRAMFHALNTLWPTDGVHNAACAMFTPLPQYGEN